MEGTAEVMRESVQNKDRDLGDRGGSGDEFASTSEEGKVNSTNALDTLERKPHKSIH